MIVSFSMEIFHVAQAGIHPPTAKNTEFPAKPKAEWPGILSGLDVGALD